MLKGIMQRRSGFRGATIIQFGSKYLNVVVSLAITMVLARILTPEDYGTVAMVSVFIGLFSLFTNMGIGPAVIQYRELTDEDCSALMSFTLILGFASALVFCALSWPMSRAFGRGEYVPLMCLASLSVLFHSANMVPNGMLIRDKRFLAAGIRLIVVTVLSGVASVILALCGFGAYALVLHSVISAVGAFVWNFVASGLRFGNWHFKSQLALVGKFSAFQFASQFMQYLIRNLDNFLVGSVLGTTALGFYDKAYKLAKYPVDYLPGTINPVLKTFFADCEGDMGRLYDSYLKVQKVMSILGVFFSVVFCFASEELVLLMFGDQWGASVEPFGILAVSISFQVLNFTVFSVLEAAKRTDYLFAHTVISSVVTIGLLVVGLSMGNLVTVSACVAAGFIVTTIPKLYFVVHKVFARSVFYHVKKFAPEFAAGCILAFAFVFLSPLLPEGLAISLAFKIGISCLIYIPLMFLFKQDKYVRGVFALRSRRTLK